MTLLAPIAGLIGALIGVPILIAFYLLKLRRRPVRVSSTLYWEQALHDLQVNVPFRWVRPTLLFLLHLLTLASLLLALARPALETDTPTADRVYVLLDRSASMAATDINGSTRFAAARTRAAELIDSLAESGAEITLLAFAAEPEVIATASRTAGPLLAGLESIEVLEQPGDPRRAIELVSTLAAAGRSETEDESLPSTLALIVTDGGDLPASTEPPLTSAATEIEIVRIAPDDPERTRNTGITTLTAIRDVDDPTLVRAFARIVNTSNAPTAAAVTIAIDGEPVRTEAVNLPAARGDDLARTPGEVARTFAFRNGDGGVLTLSVESPGDIFEADNTASALLQPGRRTAVLLVAPAGPGDRPVPDPLLEEHLAALETRSIQRTTARAANAAGPEVLSAYDVIIYDRVVADPLPPVPSLHFGRGFGAIGTDRVESPATTLTTAWDRTHPAMRDVSLDTLRVGRRLALPGAEQGASVLASGESSPLIVETSTAGADRIVVGFELAQSNWALQFGFTIFLINAVDVLSGTGPVPAVSYTTTEPIGVEAAGSIRVEGPRTFEVTPELGTTRAALGVLDRVGVYEAGETLVPVNLVSPGESALRTAGADSASAGGGGSSDVTSRVLREYWPELLGLAAALLTIEWLLYARRMRL